MPEKVATFGEWLRGAIAERRMTLAQLSRAAGCDYTYLWRLIHSDKARGRRYLRPSFQMTRRIGDALGMTGEGLAAAGFAAPEAAHGARVADRLARVEREVAELRRSLTTPSIVPTSTEDWAPVRVQVLGRIRAGEAVDTAVIPDDWIEIPHFAAQGAAYALRVRGESMQPSLVDGDVVLLDSREYAEPGEIVAISLDGEITLKRLESCGGEMTLSADNEEWAPLRLDANRPDVRILGVVTGLYRSHEGLRKRPR